MKILFFIKFGERQHIESLISKGEIFINTLKRHETGSGNSERDDKFEGVLDNLYIKEGKIEILPEGELNWKELKIFDTHINNKVDTNFFCSYSLYCITEEDLSNGLEHIIDCRNRSFGSHFALINNPTYFIKKIEEYLDSHNYSYCLNSIGYKDYTKHHDSLTLFNKETSFSHQKEFRLLVKNKAKNPLKFEIGSLENIAEIYSSESLEKFRIRKKIIE